MSAMKNSTTVAISSTMEPIPEATLIQDSILLLAFHILCLLLFHATLPTIPPPDQPARPSKRFSIFVLIILIVDIYITLGPNFLLFGWDMYRYQRLPYEDLLSIYESLLGGANFTVFILLYGLALALLLEWWNPEGEDGGRELEEGRPLLEGNDGNTARGAYEEWKEYRILGKARCLGL